ncbi:MAG: hypothetical protein KDD60_04300 [Bdellovibrionales bacterium]|nr:hypothetical protein [Bdellovibrionales bacterium]
MQVERESSNHNIQPANKIIRKNSIAHGEGIWSARNGSGGAVRGILAGFGFLLLILFFTPMWKPPGLALPSTYPDSWAFLWNIWRFARLPLLGDGVYTSHAVFHPIGTSLALHTQAELFSLPAGWISQHAGLLPAYCLLVSFAFALHFLVSFWMFRDLSSSLFVGFFLSLLLTFHPNFIGHLDGGHLNFLIFSPCLLFWWALLGEWPHRTMCSVILGLSLSAMAYSNLYYLYFSVLGALFLALGSKEVRKVIKESASLAIPLAGIVSFPKVYVVTQAYLSGSFRGDHDPALHSARLLEYFIPSVNQYLHSFVGDDFVFGVNSAEQGIYVGVGLLCATTLSLWYSRKSYNARTSQALVIVGLIFTIFSFGPNFWPFPLYQLFDRVLPFFPSVPVRFGFFAVFFLLLHVARSARASGCRLWTWLFLIMACLEVLPRPLPVSTLPFLPVLEALRYQSSVTAIHDFSRSAQQRLLHQISHEKKITSAFLARPPKRPLDEYRRNAFLRYARNGAVLDESLVFRAWSDLQIQGALVSNEQTQILERLRSLPWLREYPHDSTLTLFLVSREKQRKGEDS